MAKKLGHLAKKVLDKTTQPAGLTPPDSGPVAKIANGPAMGRPTDYEPQFAVEAERLCLAGATDQELADVFDVSPRTLNRWKITYPEFAQALLRGKEATDNRMEASLYHRGMGVEYEKAQTFKLKRIKYNDKGKKVSEEEYLETVMVKEVIPGDVTAMIFWLKNRRSNAWRDVHKIEHGRAGEFDTMSEEELRALVAQETKAIAEADPVFAKEVLLLPPPAKKRAK